MLNASEDADLAQSPLTPARAVELVKLLAEDAISSKQAKQVFSAIMDEDKDPSVIVEERGMKQVSDTGAIEAVVDAIIAANPDEVARYKEGNTKVIGFFVGQCMKEMRGQGNPKIINSCWPRSWQNSVNAIANVNEGPLMSGSSCVIGRASNASDDARGSIRSK